MKHQSVRHRYVLSIVATLLAFLTASTLISAGTPSATAPYPTKGITIIIPFSPGGASDKVGRLVGEFLSKEWKQPVTPVNKPGGSTVVGTMEMLAAKADGYTVLVSGIPLTATPAVQSDAPFKWNDPTGLGIIQHSPLLFTVPADSPWKTLKEVMGATKKEPESFKYGVGGSAAPAVFGLAKLWEAAGIDPRRPKLVIFDGGAPTLTALAGGHIHFAAQPLADSLSLVRAGKLRALATSGPSRSKDLPDVPTSKEIGYPQFDMVAWNAFFGPRNLPDNIVKKWHEGLKAASTNPDFVRKFEAMPAVMDYREPAEFKRFWEEQYMTMRSIADNLGLRK